MFFFVRDWFISNKGNQRWQTSPAAPPGGLGHCHTGMCMSNFMMIGWEMAEILHFEISRKHVSVTYDLDLWPKILVYPYVICMPSFIMIGWEMAEILHFWNFAKIRTTHTNTKTDMGITIPRPPPMGGEVIMSKMVTKEYILVCSLRWLQHDATESVYWVIRTSEWNGFQNCWIWI